MKKNRRQLTFQLFIYVTWIRKKKKSSQSLFLLLIVGDITGKSVVQKVLSFGTVSKKHWEELKSIISSVSPDPCRKTAVIEQTPGGLGKEQRVCVCVCWGEGEGEGEEVVAVLPGGARGASVFKRRHRSLKGRRFTHSLKACHRTCLHPTPLADLWRRWEIK